MNRGSPWLNLHQHCPFILTVAMVFSLPGQLPGVLHPQPAEQGDGEHAEETLPGLWQHGGLQGHRLQRVSVLRCSTPQDFQNKSWRCKLFLFV